MCFGLMLVFGCYLFLLLTILYIRILVLCNAPGSIVEDEGQSMCYQVIQANRTVFRLYYLTWKKANKLHKTSDIPNSCVHYGT